MTDGHLLAIVPARGGSKGVIHKNMRLLGGKPMIWYTLNCLRRVEAVGRLVVSTDDRMIADWCQSHGFEVVARPDHLAGDAATIFDVTRHTVEELAWAGLVGVFQPTSPLRSPDSVNAALRRMEGSRADSLSTVVREQHLFWFDDEDLSVTSPTPLFEKRVNRQFGRHRVLRETGSIQLIRAEVVLNGTGMIGADHAFFELPESESLDVDTYQDLELARARIERGRVVFRVKANHLVGSGHLFHCMQLAEELRDHELRFLLKDCGDFVGDILTARGLEWRAEADLDADLAELSKTSGSVVIVNDTLDTSEAEVLSMRRTGASVVTIEDLGAGARFADWVVNALYPPRQDDPVHIATGARWATLRPEFHGLPARQVRPVARRVLLTFGGTDPAGLSARFAAALADELSDEIEIVVLLGPAVDDGDFPARVQVLRTTPNMAAEMRRADLVVTSAGRTVFEAAATGTPVVVAAQNAREATHSHLDYSQGVLFLGIADLLEDDHLVAVVRRLLDSAQLRSELSRRLESSVDTQGALRIAERIRALLKGLV